MRKKKRRRHVDRLIDKLTIRAIRQIQILPIAAPNIKCQSISESNFLFPILRNVLKSLTSLIQQKSKLSFGSDY